MSQTSGPNDPLLADDALPPVEPPNAGFIVQLFVVPGIIVVIIVMVWLVFNWVARTSNDPQQYIHALRRDHASRWQAAVNLANALRLDDAQGKQLRQDSQLARELASILDGEVESSGKKADRLQLKMFLCRALGEFEVDDGLPVLLKIANTQTDDEQIDARLSALHAVALLSNNLREADGRDLADDERVREVLLAAAHDQNPRVRSSAAFALGAVGGKELLSTLETMLTDSYPDVRYNTATWLGSRGDSRALDVLLEMIDPSETEGVELEQEQDARVNKQASMIINGLRAIDHLADKNPDVDLSPAIPRLDKLIESQVNPQLKIQAKTLLKKIQARPAATQAA